MFKRTSDPRPLHKATPVRRKPSLDFSLTGLVYCSMMLFLGIAAINSQANLLFGVFGLMIGVLLVSGVVSRLVLRRLIVHRLLPDHSCVGQPTNVVYEITNKKRFWPTLSITLAELDGVEGFTRQPLAYLLHAAPRTTASVPAPVVPKRRGLHALNQYQLSTSFPFGFVKRAAVEGHRDMLLVFPPLGRVDSRLLALCRSADTSGATMRPRPGGSDEFYGVKEYRAGDNPRWIYWRRSARTGVLVSREMTQVAPPRLLLLVDTFLARRTIEEHAAVERCIAMAASLADRALDDGLSVGLFVWSEGWNAMSPTRGKRHRSDLLSVLARLPLNISQNSQALLDHCQPVLKSGTTPVLFTPREVQLGLSDQAGGRMIVVPANSPSAKTWFRFDPEIDFTTCMPADQQPGQ